MVAVKSADVAVDGAASARALLPSGAQPVAPPSGEGVLAFQQAGWTFAQTAEGLKAAARSGTTLPGISAVREVSLTRSGRVVATGDVLSVKLDASFDPKQATRRLFNDQSL